MTVLALAAKVLLAVTLVMAGAAKLGTLPAFAGTVRQFLTDRVTPALARPIAVAIVLAEFGLGAVSLALPSRRTPDVLMLLFCCGLLATATVGYALHRGKSCNCFGGLSRGTFGVRTVVRCVLMVAAAAAVLLAPVSGDRTAGLGGTANAILLVISLAAVCLTVSEAAQTLRYETK